MIITTTPGLALERICLDIVGPQKVTSKLNEYILTMQDQLTKFGVAIAIPDATAITVADNFIQHFVCYFGAPRVVLTDQGQNFLSSFMKRIAKRFKIKQERTTAYHPQSNASLERSHHTLAEYIKQFVSTQDEWDCWVNLTSLCYNTNVHESTGYTPYELLFGRLARLPSAEQPEPADLLSSYENYIRDLVTRLHELQKHTRERLVASKERNKKYYDKHIHPVRFALNDNVFLLKGGKIKKYEN